MSTKSRSNLAPHVAIVLLLIAASVTAGCHSKKPSGNDGQPVYIDYRLPELAFEIKVTHQLRKCAITPGVAGEAPKIDLVVKTAVETSPKVVTNSDHVFRFNPTTLSRWRQDRKIGIELHPNGTIKSINATSEDKTGAMITGIFKIAANIARMVFGFAGDGVGVAALPKEACKKEVRDFLASADSLEQRVESLNAALEELLTSGSKPSKSQSELIEAYRTRISSLKSRLGVLRTKHLTMTVERKIDPEELDRRNSVSPKKQDLEKWFDGAFFDDALYQTMVGDLQGIWVAKNWGAPPDQPILAVELYFKESGKPEKIDVDATKNHSQLVLRRPVVSQFSVCLQSCATDDGVTSGTKVFEKGVVAIPQWGTLEWLDFSVGVFDKRVLALGLSESGVVLKLNWEAPSRVASAITALSGATEAAASFADTVQYGKETAELKELDTQIGLYEKRVKLKEAKEAFDEAFSTDSSDVEEE